MLVGFWAAAAFLGAAVLLVGLALFAGDFLADGAALAGLAPAVAFTFLAGDALAGDFRFGEGAAAAVAGAADVVAAAGATFLAGDLAFFADDLAAAVLGLVVLAAFLAPSAFLVDVFLASPAGAAAFLGLALSFCA